MKEALTTAAAEETADGEWVSLAALVNRCGGMAEAEHMRGWALDGLRTGRLPYRYYTDEQQTFRHDLPPHFWSAAKIHWTWSLPVWGPLTAQGVHILLPKKDKAASEGKLATQPTPKLSNEDWIRTEVARREEADDIPATITDFARQLEGKMLEPDSNCRKPLNVRTIENRLRDWKLWPHKKGRKK